MKTPMHTWRGRAALLRRRCCVLALPAAAAGTLDKVKETGKLTLGYRADTRPFAFSEGGKPAGFSVALCQKVADAVKAELKLPALAVEFVPLTAANRFEAVQQGRVDLSCGTDTPTLERRALVDFSIPIFFAGTGALLRSDADRRLRDALENRPDPTQPVWRGAPGVFSSNVVFAAVGGTTIEKIADRPPARAAHHRHRRAGGRLRGRRADGARAPCGGAVRRPAGAARCRQARPGRGRADGGGAQLHARAAGAVDCAAATTPSACWWTAA